MYNNFMKFKYARDALKFLIQKYSIKELRIPYYLCDVIRHALFEGGAQPLFYHTCPQRFNNLCNAFNYSGILYSCAPASEIRSVSPFPG